MYPTLSLLMNIMKVKLSDENIVTVSIIRSSFACFSMAYFVVEKEFCYQLKWY